jgi:integrase
LDEYLASNPEISNQWEDVIAELGGPAPSTFGTLKRIKKVDPNRRLSKVFKRYLQINTKIGDSARSDFGTSVRRFIEFHGDMDVSEIDRSHVEQFRDALIQLPVRPPNTIRTQSVKQQISWAGKTGAKTIKQGAINKNLMGVKRTLDFAFEETSLFQNRNWRNPFDGFSKPVGQPENPVEPFTTEQLQMVFSDQIFVTKTAERFWIPLLLFYTGARLDEISQLHITDVVMEPVPHILAENLEDEDPALAKKLKTLSSHRTIPIHNGLIEIGFLQYVDAVRDRGHRHLFPNLPHAKGKDRGGYTSRTFMNAFRKHGEHNPTSRLNTLSLRTHSLRHSYRLAGYEVPDQEFVQIVMGHYVGGDSVQTYGPQIYRMPHILHQRVTSLIPLAKLDMEYLKTEAMRHLSKVQLA